MQKQTIYLIFIFILLIFQIATSEYTEDIEQIDAPTSIGNAGVPELELELELELIHVTNPEIDPEIDPDLVEDVGEEEMEEEMEEIGTDQCIEYNFLFDVNNIIINK